MAPIFRIAILKRRWPCDLVLIGDRAVLKARADQLGVPVELSDYSSRITSEADTSLPSTRNSVLDIPCGAPVVAGYLDSRNASAVLRTLERAAQGCLSGEFAAVVTAPVHKSIINDAGIPFSGHTEYFAEKTGVPLPVMMLVADKLRVALATTHLPLNAVSRAITIPLLTQIVGVMHADLQRRFGIADPRILVCGLNPHAGEGGHLGREELDVIAPALDLLRAQGMLITGPAPADTAFTPRMLAEADAVLAMFHDQGLPVLKYAGFGHAVNVTLGLPIIRTSVDHGTALDLAGTGKANTGSLIAALELAIDLVARR